MEVKSINGYKGGLIKRFRDLIGALNKGVKLKRMEPYADIINSVLSECNTDAEERTMMFKLIRHPEEGTTNRKSHVENVAYIAGEIADHFDWLNSDITRIMGENHDTGHTFLGHSGEWWISEISDKYGMPNFVHNATGVRKLVYRNDIYNRIEEAIRKQEPTISNSKLAKIKRDLWLIMDGINCHNGEKSEYSYSPDFSKSESRFENEVMGCYVKRGFDRTLIPATAEGSLMRLCDKISYIPFDMVDIFRNHCNIEKEEGENGSYYDFYEEYRKRFEEMGMPEGSMERLLACKTDDEYDAFALEMQKIFIEDVVKNTRRNNIRMSPEMSATMHGIRSVNSRLMVNHTVMKEDRDTYIPAIEKLMMYYKDFLVGNRVIIPTGVEGSPIQKLSQFSEVKNLLLQKCNNDPKYSGLIEFICQINPEDFKFTVEACKKSLEQSIDAELDIACDVASGRISRETIKAKGYKAERIETYINGFSESLQSAYNQRIFREFSNNPVNNFMKKVWLKKTKARIKKQALSGNPENKYTTGILSLSNRVAMDIGAQYIASLNDGQFFNLLRDSKLITEEQAVSLQRPYNTFDFRKESKMDPALVGIVKTQQAEEAEEAPKVTAKGKKKKNELKEFSNR